MKLAKYFPILDWGAKYRGETFVSDMVAAVIVTIMLIPQSLAYALLAGLPPQIGLYASILPLIVYAIFGTSRQLAVGPVAILSLMTAAAAGKIAAQGSAEYIEAALILAFLSGAILLAMGLFRMGFLANFLSHPVVSGFITASGVIIAASQMKHILGIDAGGHNLFEIVVSLFEKLPETNLPTLYIGAASLIFLFWVRGQFKPLLMRLGLPDQGGNHCRARRARLCGRRRNYCCRCHESRCARREDIARGAAGFTSPRHAALQCRYLDAASGISCADQSHRVC